MPTSAPRRPSPAKLQLVAAGRRIKDFAEFHGTSADWVGRVLNGEEPPPARFRSDLARFLALPEELLFPAGEDRP